MDRRVLTQLADLKSLVNREPVPPRADFNLRPVFRLSRFRGVGSGVIGGKLVDQRGCFGESRNTEVGKKGIVGSFVGGEQDGSHVRVATAIDVVEIVSHENHFGHVGVPNRANL